MQLTIASSGRREQASKTAVWALRGSTTIVDEIFLRLGLLLVVTALALALQ
jgi:hypothetical protein